LPSDPAQPQAPANAGHPPDWDSTLGYPGEGPARSNTALRIFSQNVTGANNVYYVFAEHAQDHDILLLQETKITADKLPALRQHLAGYGFYVHAAPASTTAKGGISGGALIAWRRHLDTWTPATHTWTNRVAAWGFTITGLGRFLLGSVYGHVGTAELTQQLLRRIYDSHSGFVLLGGDFNIPDQEMHRHLHVEYPRLQVFPFGPTCTTSTGTTCID
jgi:exonuclease III